MGQSFNHPAQMIQFTPTVSAIFGMKLGIDMILFYALAVFATVVAAENKFIMQIHIVDISVLNLHITESPANTVFLNQFLKFFLRHFHYLSSRQSQRRF